MAKLFFSLSLLFCAVGFSQSSSTPPNLCQAQATKMAEMIDSTNGTRYSQLEVTIVETSRLKTDSALTENVTTFNFGDGESFLEIVYRPHLRAQGDCIFESAVVVSPE